MIFFFYLNQEQEIFIWQAVFEFQRLDKIKDDNSSQVQFVSLLLNKYIYIITKYKNISKG
jgi:hypothetical protein